MMARRSSDWLPYGHGQRKPEYFWTAATGSGRYSIRTPWLSVTLAIVLLVFLAVAMVLGLVLAISREPGWWFLVAIGVVMYPFAMWGSVLSVRYARAVRWRGQRAPTTIDDRSR